MLPTVTPEVEARRASPLVAKMPPMMLVAPVKALAPESVKVPDPVLVIGIAPEIAPLITPSPAPVRRKGLLPDPVFEMVPDKVKVPLVETMIER